MLNVLWRSADFFWLKPQPGVMQQRQQDKIRREKFDPGVLKVHLPPPLPRPPRWARRAAVSAAGSCFPAGQSAAVWHSSQRPGSLAGCCSLPRCQEGEQRAQGFVLVLLFYRCHLCLYCCFKRLALWYVFGTVKKWMYCLNTLSVFEQNCSLVLLPIQRFLFIYKNKHNVGVLLPVSIQLVPPYF